MRIPAPARIGIISDTHGSLHPRVAERFGDVDLVVHAGDVGGPALLLELEALAPLLAVRGNTDRGGWAHALPDIETAYAGDMLLVVVHDASLVTVPVETDVLVSGHTHRPSIDATTDVLRLNPGSASRPHESDPRPTVMLLEVHPDGLHPRILYL